MQMALALGLSVPEIVGYVAAVAVTITLAVSIVVSTSRRAQREASHFTVDPRASRAVDDHT